MTIATNTAHGPGISFRIRFRGELGPTWFATLQDVTLTSKQYDKVTETTLAGEAPDEGALLGILNMLYELGCSIITVETFALADD